MASKYPIQKEDQDLVSTDKYLDASGHWSVPEGGSSTLADLTDVEIENPTDGQTLLYNSTTHKFENGDGGSANIPEYTYSYWLAHRAELEATGKPFIVTNAPPSPDLTAENIGYGTSNVGAALDTIRNSVWVKAPAYVTGSITTYALNCPIGFTPILTKSDTSDVYSEEWKYCSGIIFKRNDVMITIFLIMHTSNSFAIRSCHNGAWESWKIY